MLAECRWVHSAVCGAAGPAGRGAGSAVPGPGHLRPRPRRRHHPYYYYYIAGDTILTGYWGVAINLNNGGFANAFGGGNNGVS